MHLTPHWIPLVASLGLLAGGLSASAAEEAFDLWNECAKACVLDLKDGVRSSRMSVDPAIADTNGQGVLHYSMVLEGGNDALKLAIDNALSITSDGLAIRLEGGVEPNKPVRYSYTRQARGSWSLNWLVPIGHEKPSNIKMFIHELNAGNQLSHMSPIYTIEMGDELLAKLARDATFFVRAHESNEMQPTLAISHAGVSVVMAQTQPRREKRWSEWASGKVLCLLDPLDGVYNYLAQQRCNLDDTWEGKIYRVLAGNPAKHDLDIKPTVISHRLHFPEGGSLAALTAHQACHLPLETFTRHRQPRGWEQLEQCGYPVQRLVALYLAARLSWNQVDQVIRNALASPGSGGDLGEAIREQPEQARLALTLAAAESERFVRQGTGNDEAGAASADVVSLTCPVAAGECAGPADSGDALLERNYPTGAEFLGDGGDVSFSTRGTQNWTVERLLQAHRQLEERGYVFVGYHGTFLEAAQSIVFGGVRAQPGSRRDLARFLYRRRSGAGLRLRPGPGTRRARPDPQRCPAAGLCAALEPAGLLPHRPDPGRAGGGGRGRTADRPSAAAAPGRHHRPRGGRRAPGDHSRLAAGRAHRGDSLGDPHRPAQRRRRPRPVQHPRQGTGDQRPAGLRQPARQTAARGPEVTAATGRLPSQEPAFSGPGHTSGFPDASPIEYEFILIGNPPNLRLPRFRSSRKRP